MLLGGQIADGQLLCCCGVLCRESGPEDILRSDGKIQLLVISFMNSGCSADGGQHMRLKGKIGLHLKQGLLQMIGAVNVFMSVSSSMHLRFYFWHLLLQFSIFIVVRSPPSNSATKREGYGGKLLCLHCSPAQVSLPGILLMRLAGRTPKSTSNTV